ncbi:mucin-5AC-like [Anopheles merus]|uniref:mucin-5AC-like n=1 Tax=Anopheles merus TaxID=30066 RepID=UPI001BE467F1|nr:mucin-5AC-like [Anopheles merus]
MTAEGLKEFKKQRELEESFVPPQSSGSHAVSIPTVSRQESQSAGSSKDSAVKVMGFQLATTAGLPTIRLGAPLYLSRLQQPASTAARVTTAPIVIRTAAPIVTRTAGPTATRTAAPTATRTAAPTATRTAALIVTRTAAPTATRTTTASTAARATTVSTATPTADFTAPIADFIAPTDDFTAPTDDFTAPTDDFTAPTAASTATRTVAPLVPVDSATVSDLYRLITENANQSAKQAADINRRLDVLTAQNESLQKEVAVVRKTTAVLEAVVNRMQQTLFSDEDGSSRPVPEDFTLQPVRSEDELNDLERKLSDREYMRNCVSWLHSNITSRHMDKRLKQLKELVLDATFVLRCRWSARNDKIAMSHFPNVCELFRKAASWGIRP